MHLVYIIWYKKCIFTRTLCSSCFVRRQREREREGERKREIVNDGPPDASRHSLHLFQFYIPISGSPVADIRRVPVAPGATDGRTYLFWRSQTLRLRMYVCCMLLSLHSYSSMGSWDDPSSSTSPVVTKHTPRITSHRGKHHTHQVRPYRPTLSLSLPFSFADLFNFT